MIAQRLVINNSGPVDTIFHVVVAGTALKFPIYVEDETSPGVFVPFAPVDGTYVAQIRYLPSDEDAIASLTVTPRSGQPGWIDFLLLASVTLDIGNADVHFACKYVPAAPNQEHAFALAAGIIPIRYSGTR